MVLDAVMMKNSPEMGCAKIARAKDGAVKGGVCTRRGATAWSTRLAGLLTLPRGRSPRDHRFSHIPFQGSCLAAGSVPGGFFCAAPLNARRYALNCGVLQRAALGHGIVTGRRRRRSWLRGAQRHRARSRARETPGITPKKSLVQVSVRANWGQSNAANQNEGDA
jgi:hypothetical protein